MCAKHGEGKRWFLKAKNYSDDLLSDLRRRRYIRQFADSQKRLIGAPEPMERYARIPWPLKPLVRSFIERTLALDHYGQVITPSEAREIIGMTVSVVRLPCMCRRITLGGEHRVCFGFSLSPDSLGAAGVIDHSYWRGPDGTGLELLTPAQALALLEEYEDWGLVHSVWTFRTPYIGGMCNCDADGCRAMQANLSYGLRILHPGEGIARIDGLCVGCGRCVSACPFGAIEWAGNRKAVIDPALCFGCGLCERACPAEAIRLWPRVPRSQKKSAGPV